MENRIKSLQDAFEGKFDGYLVTSPINILYFTDFSGASTLLVPSDGYAVTYVHNVNYEEARVEAKNCNVRLVKQGENLFKTIADQTRSLNLKKLAFDTMSFQTHRDFSKALKGTASLTAKSEYVWTLRRVKDARELRFIRKAAELTVEGMQTACDTIKPGLQENEIAAEIEYAMRTHGSDGVAFETIVASGKRSAYPHGGCGERKVKSSDLIVVDIGAKFKNYNADMSRTFAAGKPSAKQKRFYDIVKAAHEKAFQTMKDGVKAAESDAEARSVIEEAGYGAHFVHGLGHGVGLEVHEQPVLNSVSKDVLKTGNVVTDEPGLYFVDVGGYRIEDTVLVKKDKAVKLTEGLYSLNTL